MKEEIKQYSITILENYLGKLAMYYVNEDFLLKNNKNPFRNIICVTLRKKKFVEEKNFHCLLNIRDQVWFD